MLAIALTRDLAEHFLRRYSNPLDTGTQAADATRVAVRVSASAFDPFGGDRTDSVPVADVGRRFDYWLAEQLTTVYGVSAREAAGLVAGGWILPVVDGIDEMDAHDTPPLRASILLAALNQPVPLANGELRPVVLTCRAGRYSELATSEIAASLGAPEGSNTREALQDATVVQVEPLTPNSVREYLLFRFPDPAGSEDGQTRWRPILDRLAAAAKLGLSQEEHVRQPQNLAHEVAISALRSPLKLFLVVYGYRNPQADPEELLGFKDAASLDAHLLGLLIPAVTTMYSRFNSSSYSPQEVTTWFTTLASHLDVSYHAGRSRTDLLLHELWRAAGPRLPRYVTALMVGALCIGCLAFSLLGMSGKLDSFGNSCSA